MIGKGFWAKLSAAQQKMMTDLWAANIAEYRKSGIGSQDIARKILETNGVKIHEPGEAELAPIRKAMIADLPTLIDAAKLSPEMVKLVKESL
jgi:TRAP-type C4-dicarboxylate transport system substrate-binding protein